MTVTLRDARSSSDDREWIRTVYRQYLSELSTSRSGLFPALGEWDAREYEFLAGWFADPASHPFVLLQDRERVGFALVSRTLSPGRPPPDYRMSEFFVIGSARRRGVGLNGELWCGSHDPQVYLMAGPELRAALTTSQAAQAPSGSAVMKRASEDVG